MQVKLKVLEGSQAGKKITISGDHFLVGRDAECHLRPRSDLISRRHCEVVIEGGEVIARDLGSRNGTYVNDERLEGDCRLKAGDHLRFGRLEFEVQIDHSIAGPKRPKVQSVKEAATRTVEDRGQGDEISGWLQEADDIERVERQIDPETRQFKLDETDRIDPDAASEEDAKADDQAEGEEKSTDGGKPKKEPGKLPKRQLASSKDSSEAASDMLKKMFNRR